MVASKVFWLLLEGIFLGFFCHFGSVPALIAGALLILLPILAVPFHIWILRRLQVQIQLPTGLQKSESGICSIRVSNPTLLPVLCLQCAVLAENQLNGERYTQLLYASVLPKGKQSVELYLKSDYCGHLRASAVRLSLYDAFRLIPIRRKWDAVEHMVVLPETFPMHISLRPSFWDQDDTEQYAQDRAGSDLTETYQIREYVPGDSPKQVHWKLSSKFERLIVRDPALPIAHNVLVFWERTGVSRNRRLTDAQAEVMISVCRALVEQSILFSVGWNDTDRDLCIVHEIKDMDDLVGIIPRILRASGKEMGVSGAELLCRTRSDVLCAHMVYLCEIPQSGVTELQQYGCVTMLLCGNGDWENGIVFDSTNYQQRLMELEI